MMGSCLRTTSETRGTERVAEASDSVGIPLPSGGYFVWWLGLKWWCVLHRIAV